MSKPNPVSVRIPTATKDWLKARAKANSRTLSGEIIALLTANQAEQAELERPVKRC